MRLLICGDRNWNDYGLILATLANLIGYANVQCVIEGEARGADRLGAMAARELGIPVHRFPANWTLLGKKAGPIRNQQMLNEGKPTAVLAFHANYEQSKGTKNMCELAVKAGLPVRLIIAQGVYRDLDKEIIPPIRRRFI